MFYGTASVLAGVVFLLMQPLLLGSAIDAVRRKESSGDLLGYAVLLVGITPIQALFNYLQRMVLVTMSRDVDFDIRNAYFGALEKQSQDFFHDHPTGDLMARATHDVQAVRTVCGPVLIYGANALFTVIGCLYFMLRIDFHLTAISLIMAPLVILSDIFVGRRIHSAFSFAQAKVGEMSARVQVSLACARGVRAYSQETHEVEAFRRVSREYMESNCRFALWSTALPPLHQMLIGFGFTAALWYGGLLVIQDGISLGEFVSFNFFLARLVWPVIALGWTVNLTQRGLASLDRIRKVLDAEPSIRDRPGLQADHSILQGGVSFRDLTFSYSEHAAPVLREIDLQVAPGQTVAVVGRTGSGKSTLLSLIPRLLDPPEGRLFVDNTDIVRLPLARLRSSIAFVPQETFLFSATIAENITFGRPEAPREDVAEAARLAGLESDIAAFPQGLDTLVGERGLTLSGGQKQRVALARALLLNPRMLLLDDCLSAVDTKTEDRILRNLRSVFRGRTVFLVSNRVSTVRDADLIVVLEHGRIAERGTHAQLLAANGLYGKLHRRQHLEEGLATI
jgi:ATP-binding cassette subfamily B multidrug efflux pump